MASQRGDCDGSRGTGEERNMKKKKRKKEMVLLENTDSIEHSARGRRSMETDSLF